MLSGWEEGDICALDLYRLLPAINLDRHGKQELQAFNRPYQTLSGLSTNRSTPVCAIEDVNSQAVISMKQLALERPALQSLVSIMDSMPFPQSHVDANMSFSLIARVNLSLTFVSTNYSRNAASPPPHSNVRRSHAPARRLHAAPTLSPRCPHAAPTPPPRRLHAASAPP